MKYEKNARHRVIQDVQIKNNMKKKFYTHKNIKIYITDFSNINFSIIIKKPIFSLIFKILL